MLWIGGSRRWRKVEEWRGGWVVRVSRVRVAEDELEVEVDEDGLVGGWSMVKRSSWYQLSPWICSRILRLGRCGVESGGGGGGVGGGGDWGMVLVVGDDDDDVVGGGGGGGCNCSGEGVRDALQPLQIRTSNELGRRGGVPRRDLIKMRWVRNCNLVRSPLSGDSSMPEHLRYRRLGNA
jgi:hypothetical protein